MKGGSNNQSNQNAVTTPVNPNTTPADPNTTPIATTPIAATNTPAAALAATTPIAATNTPAANENETAAAAAINNGKNSNQNLLSNENSLPPYKGKSGDIFKKFPKSTAPTPAAIAAPTSVASATLSSLGFESPSSSSSSFGSESPRSNILESGSSFQSEQSDNSNNNQNLIEVLYKNLIKLHNNISTTNNNQITNYNIYKEFYIMASAVYQSLDKLYKETDDNKIPIRLKQIFEFFEGYDSNIPTNTQNNEKTINTLVMNSIHTINSIKREMENFISQPINNNTP
jgi:hypothetical protein